MKLKYLSLIPLLSTAGLAQAAYFERINEEMLSNSASPSGEYLLSSKASLPSNQLSLRKQEKSTVTGAMHTRYRQEIEGVPVWTGEVIVHEGATTRVNGKLLRKVNLDEIPKAKYSAQEAEEHIVNTLLKKYSSLSESDIQRRGSTLYLYQKNNENVDYIFHVDTFIASKEVIIAPQYIVSGADLQIIKSWNNLHSATVTGTGPGGNEKTGQYEYGEDFSGFLVEESNGTCTMENENVKVVDLQHSFDDTPSQPFQYPCSEASQFRNTYKAINGAYSPANDAYYFGNLVFNLYQEWYGVKPIPMQLSMKVHFGSNEDNAYWTGDAMLFGDGYELFYPLVDVNVSAHEVSHGFTQFNSNLIYENQSGGMNEAFSDIAGEAAEFFMKGSVDWLVGADVSKASEALRYFQDPTLDGVSIGHIDHYWNGINVHLSSGIYNRGFYLLANTVDWGIRKAFDVFVYANQNYWIADETFSNGLCGLINAAKDLGYSQIDVAMAFEPTGVICETFVIDSDNDQMGDTWEVTYGFDSNSADDANKDFDGDGLSNLQEYDLKTNPKFNDTDFDGVSDKEEQDRSLNPLVSDTDGDGMPDGFEISYGLNPLLNDGAQDLDSDGLYNLFEYQKGLNPSSRDRILPRLMGKNFREEFEADVTDRWTTNSMFGWERTAEDATEGRYSFQNVDINNNESAVVNIELDAIEGKSLIFDLKLDTEVAFDFFRLYVNGELKLEKSGLHEWHEIEYTFTQTQKVTVTFAYEKDVSISTLGDYARIDNVRFNGLLDENNNQMHDQWELFYGVSEADQDADNDTLTNLQEYLLGSSPILSDSDEDGINDQDEAGFNTSAILADTDGDGINDQDEINLGLNPTDPEDAFLDLDADGYSNLEEYEFSGSVNDRTFVPQTSLYLSNNFDELSELNNWKKSKNAQGSWYEAQGQFKAQAISNDMIAAISFQSLFEPGSITFDLSMDTETDQDYFLVLVNGDELEKLSGEQQQKISINLDRRGIHTIELQYVKNSSRSSQLDFVAIDNFEYRSIADIDGDGLSNDVELDKGTDPRRADSDLDNVLDGEDAFPLDQTEWKDTDGDGYGDNSDVFVNDASEWKDTDGDGYGDNSDAFVNDASEWLDTDGDGYGDNTDAFDNDASEWKDTDGDGYGDNSDVFVNDASEWKDTDADGYGDNADAFDNDASEWKDTDGDGYGDNSDVFVNDASEWKDTDADGYGDNADAFDNDASEWLDSDGDGHGDNKDRYPHNPNKYKKEKDDKGFLGLGMVHPLQLMLFMLIFAMRRRHTH